LTKKYNTIKCYLCGEKKIFRRLGVVRDSPSTLINECKSCGLVFLHPIELSDSFYENSKMHGAIPLDINVWKKEAGADDTRRFHFMSQAVANKDLLDFGCGVGGFLELISEKAGSVVGIEIEDRLIKYLHSKKLIVFKNLTQLPESAKFDFITAFHVIEHLKDPSKTLALLSAHLKNDKSEILIEVPSSRDALLSLYESKEFSEFTYWSCHLYLFDANNLKLLAQKSGLRLNYVKGVQRYSLANHLYWLSKGRAKGHQHWHFLEDFQLTSAYESCLSSLGLTDTLYASFSLIENSCP